MKKYGFYDRSFEKLALDYIEIDVKSMDVLVVPVGGPRDCEFMDWVSFYHKIRLCSLNASPSSPSVSFPPAVPIFAWP